MASSSTLLTDLHTASTTMTSGRAAIRVVCAQADGFLTVLCVRLYQSVSCDEVLCEFHQKGKDGGLLVSVIVAPDHGVLKPIGGEHDIFARLRGKKTVGLFVKKGTPLFLITREKEGYQTGTIRGLTPRPTRVMFLRRQRLIRSYLCRAQKRYER